MRITLASKIPTPTPIFDLWLQGHELKAGQRLAPQLAYRDARSLKRMHQSLAAGLAFERLNSKQSTGQFNRAAGIIEGLLAAQGHSV